MMKHGFMGAVMAAMMLWMLHDPIMSGGITLSLGAIGFVLAHVAVVAGIAALAFFVPRLRLVLKNHQPGLRHVAVVMCGMMVSAVGIHLFMHGGV